MLIGGFLVGVLLFKAWQHFVLLQHGYEVEQLRQERAELVEVGRKLQLEIQTLTAPARIEDIAIKQLRIEGYQVRSAASPETVYYFARVCH